MLEKIIIAGAGGQGIMLLGKILAEAAMRENKQVSWIPSYGAEVRGGTSHCMVIISDKEIGSPYITLADTLVIMNQPSLDKFRSRLTPKGVLILNSSLASIAKKRNIFAYPFTDMAENLGNAKVANIIALGCLIGHNGIVKAATAKEVIHWLASKEQNRLFEINNKALEEGVKLK